KVSEDKISIFDLSRTIVINILKDAASTAIYGSRASNGVILVRTKRATENGLKVSYNAFVSKQVATAIPERTTAIEHMELSNIAEQNRTGNPASFFICAFTY
ncbi:MAG: hypothetical protein WKF91_23100, partial [Segetibacter sp.]